MASVLIVGGVGGIGGAAARAFRLRGDDVLMADPDGAAAAGLASEDKPGRAIGALFDLAAPDCPARLVDQAIGAFGGLDAVFVNLNRVTTAPLAEWTLFAWDMDIAVNLRAPFAVAQAAAPAMVAGGGSIILTGSTASLRGGAGSPAFHAAKAGILGLCRSLALELAPRAVRVNCILPGWVDTPFGSAGWRSAPDPAAALGRILANIPMGRLGSVDEAAETVLFLASPAARYITGATIVIDGGLTAS